MTKDLRYRYLGGDPALLRFYRKYHKEVFGKSVYVHAKHHSKFSVLEHDLIDMDISPMDYAETVIVMLEKWARNKGFDHIPVSVFCGNWCLKKYMKVRNSESVEIKSDDRSQEIMWTELTVLRTFVYKNLHSDKFITLRKVVAVLRPTLNPNWLVLYDEGLERPTSQALEILAEEYNIRYANSIHDILNAAHGQI